MTGIARAPTLWGSTLNFQLLNGPAKADYSKIIMVNPYGAFGCTNRFGSGVVFHKIQCYKETEIVAYYT